METVVGTEFTTSRLTKTFERSFKMSSEYIKHNGARVKKRSIMTRGKKYKYNKAGKIVEIGGIDPDTNQTVVQTTDDFVIGGTKSSLRRIADLEANVAILYTKLTTSDGEQAAESEDSDDISVGKSNQTTRFKGNVRFEKNVDAKSSASVGSTFANKVIDAARERIQDIAIKPMLTGNTESGITVTYDDSGNEIDFTVTKAPKWSTARTITLTGDLTGDATFDGSGDFSLSASVKDDSHNHTISNIDGLQGALDAKATPADITSAINNLVDGAPTALNTLNELAAAIGDNASYASSITTALGNKVSTNSVQALAADGNALTVSNDTITLRKGNGTTESVSISDANTTDFYVANSGGTNQFKVDKNEKVRFAGSGATSVSFDAATNKVTISSTDTDTNTWRPIHDSPVDGATTTSISSNWAFDNVKKAVPSNAVFTDTNTWRGISDSPGNDSGTSISRKWAMNAFVGASVSNDTITFTKGDGTTTSVTTSDANSNTYVTGASFNTSNGVLTMTRNSGSVTVDLDGRYQAAGSYAAAGRVITAGNGLTGGGNLTANRTINVGGGNGITVSADGVAMSGSYTGTFTASGDVCAYSDASLKTNVQTIEGALDKVSAVRGVTFERIADGSVSAGVVAQELEAVLPEAVKTDEEGVKMVAYGNITGLLIEAVKELSAQVEELKKNQK